MSASTLPSAINADTFSNPKFNILNAAFGPMPLRDIKSTNSSLSLKSLKAYVAY